MKTVSLTVAKLMLMSAQTARKVSSSLMGHASIAISKTARFAMRPITVLSVSLGSKLPTAHVLNAILNSVPLALLLEFVDNVKDYMTCKMEPAWLSHVLYLIVINVNKMMSVQFVTMASLFST